MRISDWSSDVCSSDLRRMVRLLLPECVVIDHGLTQLNDVASVARSAGDALADRRARVKFLWLWVLMLLARFVLSGYLPLFGDEAFYWLEGQHLAWAYSDLPAATAALARLGVVLGGNQAWALRLPFGLLAALMPWLVIAIARHLGARGAHARSEEHTSELQSLMRISYAVFCLKKKKYTSITHISTTSTKR